MTRLKQARAMHAKRQQTRAAIRDAIDVIVQDSGHKPSIALRLFLSTVVDDLHHLSGATGALRGIEREHNRIVHGYGLDV